MSLAVIACAYVGYAIDSQGGAKAIFPSYPTISTSAGGISILLKTPPK